ncbi:MAG: hypothetical protein CMF45_09555 [Legionellales bacterium]|nr:hypothetical protein [Legionellales bacterium]
MKLTFDPRSIVAAGLSYTTYSIIHDYFSKTIDGFVIILINYTPHKIQTNYNTTYIELINFE